ncbi:hypothetical protein ACQ4PT_057309 [Festuca glaucescens]
MLPYPNPHSFWISREPPVQAPNPAGSFTMAPHAYLDHQIQHYDHFFPGNANQFNSETLEAVLRPRPPAAPPATATAHDAARNGAAMAVTGASHARARKRPFRTDRHSKIRTAQGVRDRRMRLSLDVARDFFALQDQLGFDKASKTVDWLLTQSKPAIERLSAESSRRLSAASGGENGVSSSLTSAERGGRRLKEAETAGAGSGKREVDHLERAMVMRARGGGTTTSILMEQMNGGLMSSPMAVGGEYCYDLGDMVYNNGGECDDDGECEVDGDFLDGMQY